MRSLALMRNAIVAVWYGPGRFRFRGERRSAGRRPETVRTLFTAGKDVVWVPTPQTLVDQMLDMAKLTPQDIDMDLGSGDGRTVITAAKRGATATGIEYNPNMVKLSSVTPPRRSFGVHVREIPGTGDPNSSDAPTCSSHWAPRRQWWGWCSAPPSEARTTHCRSANAGRLMCTCTGTGAIRREGRSSRCLGLPHCSGGICGEGIGVHVREIPGPATPIRLAHPPGTTRGPATVAGPLVRITHALTHYRTHALPHGCQLYPSLRKNVRPVGVRSMVSMPRRSSV